MNNTIDVIVLLLFVYYIWRGWKKGFLGAVLGPVSLVAGCILSYSYYLKTQNIVISLLISLLGPFFLHITLASLLKMWALTTQEKKKLSLPSRLFGAAFSLSWSGGILVILFLLIMVIPSSVPYAGKVRDHLSDTKTYTMINYYAHQNPLEKEPERMENLAKSDEFKKVMEDDEFKSLILDPQVQQYLSNKDIEGLMKDENARGKMTDMLKNRDLVMQLFEFQKKMIEDSMGSDELDKKRTPKPKMMTIKNGI